jgi:hypothetical protein
MISPVSSAWATTGTSCALPANTSVWADRLIGTVETLRRPNRTAGGCSHGNVACLSAPFRAGRHEQLFAPLDEAPYSMWRHREWIVKAPAATGRKPHAICYAEASRGQNDNPIAIARGREEILLSSGVADEAHACCAIEVNQGTTFLDNQRRSEAAVRAGSLVREPPSYRQTCRHSHLGQRRRLLLTPPASRAAAALAVSRSQ